MKRCCSYLFWIVTLICISCGISGVQSAEGFVGVEGTKFRLNGDPFYFNGFNAYWLMLVASDPSARSEVTEAFDEAKQNGLTVARTWAFSDGGYSALQISPGTYGSQMFQSLDFAIAEAGRHGIKLILSLVNNYDNFGGRKQYVEWARDRGQQLSSDDDFFTNSLVKEFYRDHVATVLNRKNSITGILYKNDPTIMAWELMNEPRCQSDQSGTTIQGWIAEMATYVKSIDRNHLLEVGLEGFYGPSDQKFDLNKFGTDFIRNNQIAGIDFATVHSYPDLWLQNENDAQQLAFLVKWLDAHIQDAEKILRKPLVFSEYGKKSKNFQMRDEFFAAVLSRVLTSAGNDGPAAGGLFWQLLTDGMSSLRDGYEVIFSESPSTKALIFNQSWELSRVRKMYARLRDVEKWRRVHASPGVN